VDVLRQCVVGLSITLYRLTSQKKIPFYKIGGNVRFSEAHLLAWLEKHAVMPEGVEYGREAI